MLTILAAVAALQSLPDICYRAELAHAAFNVAAIYGVVPEQTMRREAQAWQTISPLCDDPTAPAVDLKAVNDAYAVIAAARAEIPDHLPNLERK